MGLQGFIIENLKGLMVFFVCMFSLQGFIRFQVDACPGLSFKSFGCGVYDKLTTDVQLRA